LFASATIATAREPGAPSCSEAARQVNELIDTWSSALGDVTKTLQTARPGMALEFALRPRFDLERSAPQRRRRLRLPRLALPIAAYWLAMAGVTHGLLRLTAEDATARPEETSAALRTAEPDDAPPSEALASSNAPPSELPSEPVAEPEVASTRPPESEVAPKPAHAAAPQPRPPAEVEPAPERGTRARAPVERPAVVTRATPPRREVRPEPRLPERGALSSSFEAPELDDAAVPRDGVTPRARVSPEPARDSAPAASLPSCESVAASANQSIDLGGTRGAPDLTRDAFASVLENGAYLAGCALPARTTLEVCAAVRDGKVVGVSAITTPPSAPLNACVRRAVAALRFPHSARLDVTRTRFEADR
jgi:hypothetical protein